MLPLHVVEQKQSIVTAVSLNDTFLITGDNNGLLTLRERKNGNKLYDLNQTGPKQGTKTVCES
jgi:hypothetical protein